MAGKKVSSAPAAPASAEVVATTEAQGDGASQADTAIVGSGADASGAGLIDSLSTKEPDAAPVEGRLVFPLQVMLRNNGGFAISEPVSGAFLQAGGSQMVWLHDEAHASRVEDNLRELAERNNLVGLLAAEPLPAAND
jgi:hypothetical protein